MKQIVVKSIAEWIDAVKTAPKDAVIIFDEAGIFASQEAWEKAMYQYLFSPDFMKRTEDHFYTVMAKAMTKGWITGIEVTFLKELIQRGKKSLGLDHFLEENEP